MEARQDRLSRFKEAPRKILRGSWGGLRHFCHSHSDRVLVQPVSNLAGKCAQTRQGTKIESGLLTRVDCRAAMLQAISVGRDFPMLEPWIINEILRREQDRRRGDRPQLELPVPDREWSPEGDFGDARNEQGDRAPERGVVIIGM